MSLIINPYSDENKFASGGIWEATQANFPALKLLYQDDVTDVQDGGFTWASKVGDVTMNAGVAGFTKDANGVYGALDLTTSITGTLPEIGALHPVFIWNGTHGIAGATVEIGNASATNGIQLAANASGYVTPNTSAANWQISAAVSPALSYASVGAMGIFVDRAGNEVRKTYSTTAGTVSTALKGAGSGLTVDIDWDTLPQNMNIPSNTASRVKDLSLWCFTNQPTAAEVATAIKWMAANPGKMYPGWAGKV